MLTYRRNVRQRHPEFQQFTSAIKSIDGAAWRFVPALLVLVLLAARVEHADALSKMKVAYKWDSVTYRFDSDEQRQQLQDSGVYAPGDAVAFDIDLDQVQNRVIMVMPHLLPGSVVTLGTVENRKEKYNARLLPYPNMSWHGGLSGCDGLTSVFRVHVDGCGRLWVPDSGVDLTNGRFVAKCPPQLVVFDLKTDEMIARKRFPRDANSTGYNSLMLNVVTEQIGNTCSDDVYAYIADAGAFTIEVFHLATNRTWRVASDYFYPEVGGRDFMVAGVPFSKMTGVLGLALTPCLEGNGECDRYLLFHSFSGFLEGKVRTSILRNESLYEGGVEGARPYIGVIGNRHYQAVGQAMNDRGILFFGQVGQYALYCWNMKTPYSPSYISMVEYDYQRIRVQMGVKLIKYPNGKEEVWSLSNNVQGVFSFDLTPNNTYPLYAIRGDVNDLIKGTVCAQIDEQ